MPSTQAVRARICSSALTSTYNGPQSRFRKLPVLAVNKLRGRSLPITEHTVASGLNVSVFGGEGDALVCLSGRLSIDSSPGVRDQLLTILDRESLLTLTIDLAEVTYIDCSGLATLVEALKIAHHH